MVAVTRRLFTLQEYHRLGEMGFFAPDERLELIRGEILQMPMKKTLHSVCNTRLWQAIYPLIGDRATIRIQEPIILPQDSEPQPDLVIAYNQPDDYLSSHPYPENICLVIEISDSTLNYDRGVKLSLYAEDNILHYWIFNLVEQQLEIYSEPYRKGNQFDYRLKRVYLRNESVQIPCFSEVYLNLALVFH